MDSLTARQQSVLDFIRAYTHCHGYPPAIREIALDLGVSTCRAVELHLCALEKKGRMWHDHEKDPDRAGVSVSDRDHEETRAKDAAALKAENERRGRDA